MQNIKAPETFVEYLRKVEIDIPAGKEPERLDVFLARQVAELTRSRAGDMISSGEIRVNGDKVKPSHKVKPGQHISFNVPSRPPLELASEDIPLDIVWEDDYLIVINKPAGLVIHPAVGNRSGTLVNALLNHYGELAVSDDPDRPGIVHRLDKDTSGLLVVCKREPALSRMAKAFRDRTVQREYRAIVWWPMPSSKGRVEAAVGRHPTDRKKYAVRKDGKWAATNWKRLENFSFMSHIALRLETGRTHQIRLHMTDIGHPVLGDADYGGRNRQMGKLTSGQRSEAAVYLDKINRQMLHARTLGFEHPISKEPLSFDSPLPEDFEWLLEQLRQ